ncbi:hypothetical protein ACFJIW_13195 [Tahibacter sp. UC22_41]|uniref:hypothetical protein n=1 Tax=Tahibacter sp. UC22_41 TaxID=3350178 RepID=UPI0036D9890D
MASVPGIGRKGSGTEKTSDERMRRLRIALGRQGTSRIGMVYRSDPLLRRHIHFARVRDRGLDHVVAAVRRTFTTTDTAAACDEHRGSVTANECGSDRCRTLRLKRFKRGRRNCIGMTDAKNSSSGSIGLQSQSVRERMRIFFNATQVRVPEFSVAIAL